MGHRYLLKNKSLISLIEERVKLDTIALGAYSESPEILRKTLRITEYVTLNGIPVLFRDEVKGL